MKRATLVLLASAGLLASCAADIPISGRMERSDEAFSGSIAGSGIRGGTGELVLISTRRSTCRGTFVNTSRRRGEGVLNCDDGRTGSFRIAGTHGTGVGSGELSGQRFTFTFTDVE